MNLKKITIIFVLILLIFLVGFLGAQYIFDDTGLSEDDSNPVVNDTDEIDTGEHTLITLSAPEPNAVIESPLTITGEARGPWYFEATFPIVLTNWDGLIIAEHYAEAQGGWMTEEFVPFESVLEFESPYSEGDPDFMQRGTLILKKANASGLPEHDDAIEIPVLFAPKN